MIIGIISDIHEDIIRLKQSITILEKRNVDEIICLGDIVGFSVPYYNYLTSRDSNEVIDILRKNCSDIVIGNHDLYAIKRIPLNRTFFNYNENWYQLDFKKRKELSNGKLFLYEDNELSSLLTAANIDYLCSLPEYIVKPCGDHKILLTHYAFPDCTGSSTFVVKHEVELSEHFNFMERQNCLYGFSGNDHFEGFKVYTQYDVREYSFEKYELPNERVWVHGPTVSEGTFDNGIMIYDSGQRLLEAIPLNSSGCFLVTSFISGIF